MLILIFNPSGGVAPPAPVVSAQVFVVKDRLGDYSVMDRAGVFNSKDRIGDYDAEDRNGKFNVSDRKGTFNGNA